jgi:hypothetical protein
MLEKQAMKKRNLPKDTNREKVRREKDPIPWRYCLLTLVCGVFLVGGFFLAARSHFSSMDFGIKNSSLKKQIEDLESEKRRLLLLKEIAMSPTEIKKAAKKLGLTEMTASSFQVTGQNTEKTEKPAVVKSSPENVKATVTEKTDTPKNVEKVSKNGVKDTQAQAAKKEVKEKTQTQIAKK